MKTTDWKGCYGAQWSAAPLVPEAYSHPAKVSFGLSERIYQYALERGFIQTGDHVIDPFGGIGGFAFHAMLSGLNFTGVELEQKFVDLASQNIALWGERYRQWFPNYGTAIILQGDSRQLCRVIGEAAAVVSSPPFQNSLLTTDTNFMAQVERDKRNGSRLQPGLGEYGITPGQLGSMREGDYAAAISSPPYADQANGWNEGTGARFDPARHPGNPNKRSSANGYGVTDGNLGHMSACVSSPPFMGSSGTASGDLEACAGRTDTEGRYAEKIPYEKRGFLMGKEAYEKWSQTCNLGSITSSAETFWSAAALIVAQVYQVLKPGGYAFWVCKDFVRNKKRVPFSDQWQALCEAHGFEAVERIRAWVVEDKGTQLGMFGEDKTHVTERKSFFRRLAEKKGSPRIDWEDVIVMRKSQPAPLDFAGPGIVENERGEKGRVFCE